MDSYNIMGIVNALFLAFILFIALSGEINTATIISIAISTLIFGLNAIMLWNGEERNPNRL
jgi:hypothetical protein